MEIELPDSVRYVKNGDGGRWWKAAKANDEIHLGWDEVPEELLQASDFSRIEQVLKEKKRPMQDINALRTVLHVPSEHVWITFEEGYMWWCTVHDGVHNPNGRNHERGYFWLDCHRSWSKHTLKENRLLAKSNLPGAVTAVAGYRATICKPKAWKAILRIIQDEKDLDVVKAANARGEYQRAVLKMVKRLSPEDFEELIGYILARMGWIRISTLGGELEGIDLEAENPAFDEIAFVQVKSSANQKVLDEYVKRFKERSDRYARMIFAVHSSDVELKLPDGLSSVAKVWTGDKVAQFVVRLGLGEWVESRTP